MHLHARGRVEGVGAQAQFRRQPVEFCLGDVLDDERSAVELLTGAIERLVGHLDIGVLEPVAEEDVIKALSALWLIAKIVPVPVAPATALTSPFTRSIGAPSTFTSVTRMVSTANPSGKVHPVSSYGVFCGSFGAQ